MVKKIYFVPRAGHRRGWSCENVKYRNIRFTSVRENPSWRTSNDSGPSSVKTCFDKTIIKFLIFSYYEQIATVRISLSQIVKYNISAENILSI